VQYRVAVVSCRASVVSLLPSVSYITPKHLTFDMSASTLLGIYSTTTRPCFCCCLSDFWTTRCPRCPAALDAFNAKAAAAQASNNKVVQYISICCGVSSDAARAMLELEDGSMRWSSLPHYCMVNETDKETAKRELNFAYVPFYVVLGGDGKIVLKGGIHDFDWNALEQLLLQAAASENGKETMAPVEESSATNENADKEAPPVVAPAAPVFVLEDMDF
jgi:hypothetical protein